MRGFVIVATSVLFAVSQGATASTASATAYSFDGYTNTGVCVIPPFFGQCQVVAPGAHWTHDIDTLAGGPATAIVGTVTWDATTPLTDTFSVFLVGRGDTAGPRVFDRAAGHSPLDFAFDLTTHDAHDWEIHIHSLHRQDAPGLIMTQEVRQAFHVEGYAFSSE